MIVYVTDRIHARLLYPAQSKWAWISISSTYGRNTGPAELSEGARATLRLWFDDLDRAPGPNYRAVYGDPTLFDGMLADLVARFVVDTLDQGVEAWCIHCDAGISRSGGVAVALADVTGAHIAPRHTLTPNALVRALTTRALWSRLS